MAHLIGGENLHLEYPTKTVFDAVSVGIDEGDRIGIVGRNGDGKSTLMRLLAGRIAPDSGRVTVRSGTTVGMLDQADTLDPDQTVGHAVVGDVPDYVWAADPKVRDVVSGLVSDVDWDTPVGQLSGGQRRRVALASLLTGDWDVIFLDEPNNSMGCSFRTPRFYRRGRAASHPVAGCRTRARRVAPCRTALVGKGGR
uniref:ATP-binding cassette domain-containing protein n=1 Tax=Kocuria rhizophila TaxID=72000 RepID=UPI0035B60C19